MSIKTSLLLSLVLGVMFAVSSIQGQEKSSPLLLPVSATELFTLEADDFELWKVAQELSLHFKVNIIVYNDLKDKKLSCNFKGFDLEKSLNIVCWQMGVEWYLRDGTYFIGGNKDFSEVLDSSGLDKEILSVFPQAKLLEDKIIITGSEREVTRIKAAIQKLQVRQFVTVHVSGYEYSDDLERKLGLDIDKALKYSVSWESLAAASYNPIQSLVMSFKASLVAEQSSGDISELVSTSLTMISGKKNSLNIGETIDRQQYSATQYGVTYNSGYNTLQTGFLLNLEAFRSGDEWIFKTTIENSKAQSETLRTSFKVDNTVVLNAKVKSPVLIGRIHKERKEIQKTKGIPYLCDIPYLGALFRITTTSPSQRSVIFFIELLSDSGSAVSEGGSRPVASALPTADIFGINRLLQF